MHDDAEIVLGHAPDEQRSTRARRGAGLFDVFVVPLAVTGAAILLDAPTRYAGVALLLTLAVTEAVAGGSPGKLATGLTVERVADGRRPDLLRAVARRPWAVLLALDPVLTPLGRVPAALGDLGALVVLLAMVISIDRDDEGRGLHDRLLGTRVVAGAERPTLARIVIVVGIVLSLVAVVSSAGLAGDTRLA